MKNLLKKIIWALFGNDDDPNPPVNYYAHEPMLYRGVRWWFRNPFHNLTFYVLGLADEPFRRVVVYPRGISGLLVFRPEGGWYIACAKYKWLRLPFISYQGTGLVKKFYLGWRERGNLGAKLTLKN